MGSLDQSHLSDFAFTDTVSWLNGNHTMKGKGQNLLRQRDINCRRRYGT